MNSLSIWSPNPGVSTMVSEILTPSSSSSAGTHVASAFVTIHALATAGRTSQRTDVDRLDLDAILLVRAVRGRELLVGEHLRLAKRVDERCASSAGLPCKPKGRWKESLAPGTRRSRGGARSTRRTTDGNSELESCGSGKCMSAMLADLGRLEPGAGLRTLLDAARGGVS